MVHVTECSFLSVGGHRPPGEQAPVYRFSGLSDMSIYFYQCDSAAIPLQEKTHVC